MEVIPEITDSCQSFGEMDDFGNEAPRRNNAFTNAKCACLSHRSVPRSVSDEDGTKPRNCDLQTDYRTTRPREQFERNNNMADLKQTPAEQPRVPPGIPARRPCAAIKSWQVGISNTALRCWLRKLIWLLFPVAALASAQAVEMRGQAVIVQTDDFAASKSTRKWVLHEDDGKDTPIDWGLKKPPRPGARVRLTGQIERGVLHVEGVTEEQGAAAPTTPR